jgi:hypothetical protein
MSRVEHDYTILLVLILLQTPMKNLIANLTEKIATLVPSLQVQVKPCTPKRIDQYARKQKGQIRRTPMEAIRTPCLFAKPN